jgi:uncharacterized membrane protein
MASTVRYGFLTVIGIAGAIFAAVGVVQGLAVLAIFGVVLLVSACYELRQTTSAARAKRVATSSATKPVLVTASSSIIGLSLVVTGIADHEYLLVGLGGVACIGALLQLYRAAHRIDGHSS